MDDVWHTDMEQDPPDPISGPQGVSSWILVLLGVSYYCISFRNSSSIIILYWVPLVRNGFHGISGAQKWGQVDCWSPEMVSMACMGARNGVKWSSGHQKWFPLHSLWWPDMVSCGFLVTRNGFHGVWGGQKWGRSSQIYLWYGQLNDDGLHCITGGEKWC